VTIWSAADTGEAIRLAHALRAQGLRVDVYPDADKLGKQFKYAATLGVPFVAVLGEDERAAGVVTLKDLRTGAQTRVAREAVAATIREGVPSGQDEAAAPDAPTR
jgi:histidyl-tRNA synthetase